MKRSFHPFSARRGVAARIPSAPASRERGAGAVVVAACLALFAAAPVRGQEPAARPDTAGYRISSARGRSTIEDAERVIYLEGGVRIDHETTTITSERGKNYLDRRFVVLYDSVHVVDGTADMKSNVGEYNGLANVLVLKGNVRFTDRGWRVHCDVARYDRERRIAILTGHLRLADSTRTMYADTIFYYRDTEIADAVGNVVLIDETEGYSIAGKHARYDRRGKEAVVDRSPILTFDLKSDTKGIVTSRLMRFDIERRIGIATRDVKMVKGETWATCDSAVIFDAEQRAELYGHPQASNGPSSMSGAKMLLWYNDDEVRRVVLPAGGVLTEKPKVGSPWREDSYIEGDSVAINLSAEKVDSVRIVGASKAMYYPTEGEKNKVSNNYSTGDRMFFAFRDRELSYIRISGKSTGLYKYLNLAPRETIDSLSAALDSSLLYKSFPRSNERVSYNADTIEYFADTENIVLRGNAVLMYQRSSLTAERIDFNSRLNLLEATGNPVLEEDQQRMYGVDMGYDMDTQAGVIVDGSTKYGDGYYEGQDLFKVGEDILKVYRSTYTTCDLRTPHYSLRAKKMKVYINDKIVSGPIFLYIGQIPVFYLPFMVNTLRHTRSSGFLRPNVDIGLESRDGRFIRGLGYYWATNDYTDFLLETDFNERQNLRVHLGNQYKVRYIGDGGLDGGVRFDFVRNLRDQTNQWTIESDHNQSLSPTASFRSHLRFVSSDQAQQAVNTSENVQRFIDRRIYSSGGLSKSWGGTRLNLSADRNQTLNVSSPTQDKLTTTMPSFSLSFPRVSLWFGEKHRKGEQSIWERALGGIMLQPNLSATRTTQESDAVRSGTLTANSGTSFGQQRTLGFLDFSPSVSVRWNYAKQLYREVNPAYAGLVGSGSSRYTNEASMSLSLANVGTKLYGTFYPRIGSLVAVRHTINPSVSFSYTPKLSETQRESRSVSYSLWNSIDLKLKKGTEEVKQNGVISWRLNGNYNPDAQPNQRFSNLSSTVRLGLGSLIAFNLNNTYSPRERRIISTGFSTGLDLRGSFAYPATWTAPTPERVAAAIGEEKLGKAKQAESPAPEGAQPGSWSFRVNYNYSGSSFKSAGGTISSQANSNIDFSGQVRLSRGWRLSYTGYYDIEARLFSQHSYSLERDLHCWRASFTHRTFGGTWSYYFQIAVKVHPEIMYERGTRGIQSFFGGGGYPGGEF
jgi:lipopolysaccharide assembly outer membrane protein LptD (OstA)